MKIAVVILAGGEGRRIGGAKPSRLLGGRRLIDRTGDLASQWSEIVAIAVRDPEQVTGTSLACITDDPDVEGPMAGLGAGLRFGAQNGCRLILTVPADMPFLPPDLGQRLAGGLGSAGAAIAVSAGHLHPVCGLWRATVLKQLDAYLATGRRSLRGFAETVGRNLVWWPDEPFDPFFNINSPKDLAVAEQLLRN